MAKISILGTGGFGVSLAATCFRYGHEVILWGLFQQEVDAIIRDGEHKKLLPGVPVNPGIRVTADISETAGADLVILAVPSFAVRETAARVRPFLSPETVVVNVAKGLEKGSCKLLSEVIEEEIPDRAAIILSGPSHAEEIARGVPTTIDAASKSRANAEYVQDVLSNDRLRIYVCDDIIGAQLGGALKNIIAVCAGMCDGMGLGDNAKAALMTRGLAEIARLGSAMGADPATFAGLTGIGDLIVTCTSLHSRNYRAGLYIGQGIPAQEAIRRVGMTVEGCIVAGTAWKLAQEKGVEMPIVEQLNLVMEEGKDVRTAVRDLMGRPSRHENEQIWLKELKERQSHQ